MRIIETIAETIRPAPLTFAMGHAASALMAGMPSGRGGGGVIPGESAFEIGASSMALADGIPVEMAKNLLTQAKQDYLDGKFTVDDCERYKLAVEPGGWLEQGHFENRSRMPGDASAVQGFCAADLRRALDFLAAIPPPLPFKKDIILKCHFQTPVNRMNRQRAKGGRSCIPSMSSANTTKLSGSGR